MKEIFVGELQPDETVDAMREARMLSDVSLNFQFILIGRYMYARGHNVEQATFTLNYKIKFLKCISSKQ